MTAPIRLLLVEDDADCAEAMCRMLEKRGIAVTVAPDAPGAIQLFRQKAAAFDVVVSDIRLGSVLEATAGVDVLRRIREQDADLPVILITGYESVATASEAVRLKAQDYIVKPLEDIEELLVPIQKAVAHHRAIKENARLAEELRRSEHRIETVLSSVNDLVFVFDADQRFVMHRSDGRTRLYASAEGFLGRKHSEVMPPEVGRLFAAAFEKARAGEVAEYEYSLAVDGKTQHWAAKLSPIVDNGVFKGVVAVTRDVTRRRETERKLEEYRDRLRQMASELCMTEERERRALAMALHESVQQIVVAAKTAVDNGIIRGGVADVGTLEQVSGWLGDVFRQIRGLTFELYPPALYALGLRAALHVLADRIRAEGGPRVEVRGDEVARAPGEELKTAVYAAVKELLTNVRRHAAATRAVVRLWEDGGAVWAEVRDDGRGFDPGMEMKDHFGLFSLRERIRALGGEFELATQPGQGTRVRLCVPLGQGSGRRVPARTRKE